MSPFKPFSFALVLSLFLCVIGASQPAHAAQLRIALVLDKGGKDDRSFNAAAFRGATEAKNKLGIYLKEIEAGDDSLFEPAMRSFAQKKFDLIIGIGVAQAETVKKLAQEIPGQKFAIVDARIKSPNVTSLVFEEQEGSYIVGYAAGLKSKSHTVGFLGGMDIPMIRRFEEAYEQGAKAANSKTQVLANYIGVTPDAWNNPTKGKELAQNQYSRGADIVFVAAGASGSGTFDAAVANKKFAIGCDSNQNWIKPGQILTSMLKRVDTAVYDVIEDVVKDRFKGSVRTFGLKNNGIDWALDQYNEKLFTKDEIKKINDVKAQIIAGKIHVSDYYRKVAIQ